MVISFFLNMAFPKTRPGGRTAVILVRGVGIPLASPIWLTTHPPEVQHPQVLQIGCPWTVQWMDLAGFHGSVGPMGSQYSPPL